MKQDMVVRGSDGSIKLFGNVAQKLQQSGFNANALRPWIGDDNYAYITGNKGEAIRVENATLRKDEWKHMDEAILQAAQQRLRGVADLYAAGLVYRIPNGIGSTVLEWEDISDISAADLNMDGATRGMKDRPDYGIKYLPLPIAHKDFSINARALAASRSRGAALDTTMAEKAARVVAEKIESMLFTGSSSYTYGGGTIQGLMDYTYRNTVSLTANWDDSAGTGEVILADVLSMKQASIDDRMYGPWVLYIPTNFETAIDEDFKANSDKSVRQRLLEVDGITDIRVADFLTDDNVILVQMTSDVVRIVEGMAIQMVEWDSEGGMIHNYKVMGIMIPNVRSDYNNRCGVVHAS